MKNSKSGHWKGKGKMQCRVLDLPAQGALFNTALDQFLFEEAAGGQLNLVFTKWQPSVLIGNSQSLALDVDQTECQRRGVSVMRRFSGGQSVYLDEHYIVFTICGPRSLFPVSLNHLREQMCEAILKAVNRFEVPAVFFKPDNLIIISSDIRTLGNSGQVLKKDAILIQASLRYDLKDNSLKTMLAVLKTNGQNLQEFFVPAKKVLASCREFTDASPNQIKIVLAEEIMSAYGCKSHYGDGLTAEDNERVNRLSADLLSDMRLEDKPMYLPRGVCYFYLNGKCVIPELTRFLPSITPSSYLDSTIF